MEAEKESDEVSMDLEGLCMMIGMGSILIFLPILALIAEKAVSRHSEED